MYDLEHFAQEGVPLWQARPQAWRGSGCLCTMKNLGAIPRATALEYAQHRITEWFGLEGILKLIWFYPPCHKQGHLPPAQAAQSSIQPGLEDCQGGGSHSFSGQPGPGPHHLHGEEFLPNISSKSAIFEFRAIPPCPVTAPPCEKPLSILPVSPSRHWQLL